MGAKNMTREARDMELQWFDIRELTEDAAGGKERSLAARAFHNTVAAVTGEVCERIRADSGAGRVVLSGGVFQNRLLSEEVSSLLAGKGFQVFPHRLVPPNDGGLALGQAIIAGRSMKDVSCGTDAHNQY